MKIIQGLGAQNPGTPLTASEARMVRLFGQLRNEYQERITEIVERLHSNPQCRRNSVKAALHVVKGSL